MSPEVAHTRANLHVLNRVIAAGAVSLITDDRIGTGPAGHDAEELLRQSVGELRLAPMKQDHTTPDALAPDPFTPHPPSLPDGQPPSATAFKGHDA